jgi:putative oxidoreductase
MNYQKLFAYGPLPIRIIAGITFIIHGLPKLLNVAGSEVFFGKMGLPPDLAMSIGLLEVIGGVALIVGILTRVASILFIIEMIGATIVAKLSKGFVGGYELDLLLMSISISLLLTGPGKASIEWDLLNRELFPKGKEYISRRRRQQKTQGTAKQSSP